MRHRKNSSQSYSVILNLSNQSQCLRPWKQSLLIKTCCLWIRLSCSRSNLTLRFLNSPEKTIPPPHNKLITKAHASISNNRTIYHKIFVRTLCKTWKKRNVAKKDMCLRYPNLDRIQRLQTYPCLIVNQGLINNIAKLLLCWKNRPQTKITALQDLVTHGNP